jgi:hypothetical protein
MLLGGPAVADDGIRQTRVSVTIGVPNFSHAANDLRQVSESFDARLENLNMDSANGTGSASFKVPVAQLPKVMEALEKMGQIQNQNQSTSDYTSSVEQYERKTKAFRALSELDTRQLFAKLAPQQRAEVTTEFQSFVNNGLQSNENSAASYRDMGKNVEISVSLTTKPLPQSAPPVDPNVDPQPTAPQPAVPASTDAKPLYLLCLLNFLGLWAIYRRVDRPDPLEQSRHTH